MADRVTRVVTETVAVSAPNARVTRFVYELVASSAPNAHATRFVREVVMHIPIAPTERGDIDYDQVRAIARQGPGAKFQMFGGGPTAIGDMAVFDADGNVVDGGAIPTSPLYLPVRLTSVDTTLTANDYTLIATASPLTVTVPNMATGKVFNIKNGNSLAGQTIAVTTGSAVLIDTSSSISLGATASVAIQWDGIQWRII